MSQRKVVKVYSYIYIFHDIYYPYFSY